MKQPGPIAQHAVTVAERFIGVTEQGGENRGPEVEMFLASINLGPGYSWCMAYVRHCVEVAARELKGEIEMGFPDTGWCPAVKAWAEKERLWIPAGVTLAEQARRGDLALFYFSAKGRVAHVGFVTGPAVGQMLQTLEGNTGPQKEGVQREGDGVYTKEHAWSALGSRGGLVRLPF